MKYIIDVPDDNISDFLTLGDDKRLRLPIYNKNGTFNSFIPTNLTVIPYTEPDRKAVEDEVWEFMNKLIFTKYDDIRDCFGSDSSFIQILKNYSYQEAKEKYEAWKEQEEQIRVGDEVKHKEKGWKAFVTNITETGCLTLMWDLGKASCWYNPKDFEKTGKHCAEVEELIKKIGEIDV